MLATEESMLAGIRTNGESRDESVNGYNKQGQKSLPCIGHGFLPA